MLVRLPLEGTFNTRDLGGHPTATGEVTAFRAFIRSDDVANISKKDLNFLQKYGVTSVLDLRSEEERQRVPNPFQTLASFQYVHQSILPLGKNSNRSLELFVSSLYEKNREPLAEMYVLMLKESKEVIRNIFTWFSEQEGAVLFHCTAGKDRTGIISMLLLGLVEVSRSDILANYSVTHIYNRDNPEEKMLQLPFEVPASFLQSKPSYILEAYEYLLENYGSVKGYLKDIGVDHETQEVVRYKLLGK